MPGYSGTPLPKKLGIKPGSRVAVLNAPRSAGPTLAEIAAAGPIDLRLGSRPYDVIVLFCDSGRTLADRFPAAHSRLAESGGLWIAWPKKSSGVATDLDENLIRDLGLAAGLVDNKVCAIDDTWSGLRFVVRLIDRKTPSLQKRRATKKTPKAG
jgi:hypothetical protein